MKGLLVWLCGALLGVVLAAVLLWFNPLVGEPRQPVRVDGRMTAEFFTGLAPEHTPVLTHGGQRRLPRRPVGVEELWERPIRGVTAAVVVLRDAQGEPVGVASRLGGWSRETDPLLRGTIMDSHWLISLPDEGMAFVAQSENFWPMLRDIALPSMLRRQPWSGERELRPAAGPRDGSSAQVIGAAGVLRDRQGSLISSYTVSGFDPAEGPTAMDARLVLSLPAPRNDAPAGGDDR